MMWKLVRNLIVWRNYILVKFGQAPNQLPKTFFAHPLGGLVSYIREDYILEICKSKRVLHFGFLDSPFTKEKIKNNELLHTRIALVASYLYGIDIDADRLDEYRSLTGDCENCVYDVMHNSLDKSFFSQEFSLIILPEVLEHIENPGLFLKKIKLICELNSEAHLLITVPNAFSFEHFVSAVNDVELVHPDHYYYFSPVTLTRLATGSGFSDVKISLYAHESKTLNNPGITHNGIIALCKP